MAHESSSQTCELTDARILVTGGTGFLGQHLVRVLRERYGCKKVYPVGRKDADLINPVEVAYLFDKHSILQKPFDYVFHLAGYNGGIGFNGKYPADVFMQNSMMAMNVLFASFHHGVKKVLSTVTSCGYPDDVAEAGVYHSGDYLTGQPHPTIACHGYAKRNLQLASKFMHDQYGLNAVCACPNTVYGPGDSFDLGRTKVVGALIARFVEAKRQSLPQVTLWGSGKPQREIMYVDDAAHMLVETMLWYNDSERPANIGPGHEVSIAELARLIADSVNYCGEICWDVTKPDGQMRKRLANPLRFTNGQIPRTNTVDGIAKTVSWYEEHSK